MHISLGHDSVKGRLYLQVCLHLCNRLKRLLRGAYVVLLGFQLGTVCVHGFLRNE
jgi:hypothetical protein